MLDPEDPNGNSAAATAAMGDAADDPADAAAEELGLLELVGEEDSRTLVAEEEWLTAAATEDATAAASAFLTPDPFPASPAKKRSLVDKLNDLKRARQLEFLKFVETSI